MSVRFFVQITRENVGMTLTMVATTVVDAAPARALCLNRGKVARTRDRVIATVTDADRSYPVYGQVLYRLTLSERAALSDSCVKEVP